MPVADHEVHPSVVLADGAKPGCYNRKPFKSGYLAPDRIYAPDGSFISTVTWVKHNMSTQCRYDQAIQPERCAGCVHHGSQVAS